MELEKAILFVSLCALFSTAASLQDGDVRLANSSDPSRGRVEVFYNGDWASICYDYRAVTAQRGVGQTVCRQLGYYDLFEVANVTTFQLPNGTNTEKLTSGDCKYADDPVNAPQHVYRCFLSEGGCEDGDDMAVDCEDDAREEYPYDAMVDFIDDDLPYSMSLSEGFAQVYVNQQWGPVCKMQKEDADVFCRQLSFTNAVSVQEFSDMLPNPPLVGRFHCGKSDLACLRRCFNYPSKNAQISCPEGNSFVTCEFRSDTVDDLFGAYGTRSLCTATSGSNSGAVAGAVIGVLLAITGIAIAAGIVYYFIFYKKRTTRFSPSSTNTKYDAI